MAPFSAAAFFMLRPNRKSEGERIECSADFYEIGAFEERAIDTGIRTESDVHRLTHQCRNELLSAS